jgi:hypothetical protein
MKLHDLMKAFENACFALDEANPDATPDDFERTGIRAVVEALRDEIENGIKHYAWNEEDAHKFFNEILASDGVEKKEASHGE